MMPQCKKHRSAQECHLVPVAGTTGDQKERVGGSWDPHLDLWKWPRNDPGMIHETRNESKHEWVTSQSQSAETQLNVLSIALVSNEHQNCKLIFSWRKDCVTFFKWSPMTQNAPPWNGPWCLAEANMSASILLLRWCSASKRNEHQNPGPEKLNPSWTHSTHLTCCMSQSDAQLSQRLTMTHSDCAWMQSVQLAPVLELQAH